MAVTMAWISPAQIANPVKWTVEAKADGPSSGHIIWTADIAHGYHIYGMEAVKDGPVATSFKVAPVNGLTLEGPVVPSVAPTQIDDDNFSLILHQWEGTVHFSQAYKLASGVHDLKLHTEVSYMSCTDRACQPPATVELTAVIGNAQNVADDSQAEDEQLTASRTAKDHTPQFSKQQAEWWAPVDQTEMEAHKPASANSWWGLLIWGFLGGLLALLTPCVWPMIPMTLSFFLKRSKSRARSIADAVTYGLSIIVIFLVLGIAITVIFGASKLNEIATSAVFNLIFFALLVFFAISFFGAFDIKLPASWSNRADNKAESTTGLLSIFFMAFTLVLVSFSCTGPIIGTLLVEAASDGSIIGPATGMGGFALGLALPFTLFAVFPSMLSQMPKSGGWMNSVKVVLGFIELILSLKFLSVADLAYGWRILDREIFVAIWIVLFVLLGMYLLGKLRFSHDAPSQHTSVGGFFLALASFSFAVYLLPGMWGAPLKGVSAFTPPLSTQDFNLYGGEFHEFDDYEAGMAYAQEHGKPVLLDFSGYACVNCRKMEGAVFDTPAVRQAIENDYVLIKLMVDEKQALDKPYTVTENGSKTKIKTVGDKWSYLQRQKFGINSQPYYVTLDNHGNLLQGSRAYDEDASAFVDWLNNGVQHYKDTETTQQ